MLYRALLLTVVFTVLSVATTAGGQERESCNAGSACQPAPAQPTESTKTQNVDEDDADPSETTQEQTSALGPNDVVQPTLKKSFEASGTTIPCSVIDYQVESKPIISVLCPATHISAPLRVHLKMVWKNIDEVSHALGSRLVKIGGSANLRSKQGKSKLEITYQGEGDQKAQKRWFDVVLIGVGLAKEGNYR